MPGSLKPSHCSATSIGNSRPVPGMRSAFLGWGTTLRFGLPFGFGPDAVFDAFFSTVPRLSLNAFLGTNALPQDFLFYALGDELGHGNGDGIADLDVPTGARHRRRKFKIGRKAL